MVADSLFFPRLRRRLQYSTKRKGEYYNYSRYKQEIREDCLGRCVYCDAHENEAGGPESMELDHFRPKKYKEFEHLVNDPNNLVLSCGPCNRLKHDHWPALGTSSSVIGNEGFIDPFEENRQDYFQVMEDGQIVALKPPARYMIECLVLNRATVRRIRERRHLKRELIERLGIEISKIERILRTSLPEEIRVELEEHLESLRREKHDQELLLDFSLY